MHISFIGVAYTKKYSTRMSQNDSNNSTATMEPHASPSAQALAQSQPDRCGFLRKRGKAERMLENLHLSKHINWRQRFIVVKDGFCYCFADEVAKSPLQAFSLQGYNRVFRSTSDRAAFVFAVEPADCWRQKLYVFAASSDEDRKLWMQAFKTALSEANSAPYSSGGSRNSDDDVFRELEKPLFEIEKEELRNKLDDKKGPSGENNNCDEEEGSDDSDYDEPNDEWLKEPQKTPQQKRRTLPLPPVPNGTTDHTKNHTKDHTSPQTADRPSAPVRTSKSKPSSPAGAKAPLNLVLHMPPQKPKRRVSEKDCFFDDSNREAAIEILREKKAPGTYLIRKSRQGDSKVLAVMTTEDVKEYKIFTERDQVTLDKKTLFKSVDDMLEHYTKNPLPNRQQTLERSYSSS